MTLEVRHSLESATSTSARDHVMPAPIILGRVGRALRRAGIQSVPQLRRCSPEQLAALPGIGRTSATLVAQMLARGDEAPLAAMFSREPPVMAGPPHLTEQERAALRARYDLATARPHSTFQHAGEMLGVSESRVRHLRARALEKLGVIARATRLGRPVSSEARADLTTFEMLLRAEQVGRLR